MITITECEKDGLQEIMNISMGQAANAFARLIQTQVSLSVPAIKSMSPVDFNQTITSFPDCWFASQSFMGCIEGEIITGIQKTGCDALAQAMDFDLPLDKVSTEELVLEVTNILYDFENVIFIKGEILIYLLLKSLKNSFNLKPIE